MMVSGISRATDSSRWLAPPSSEMRTTGKLSALPVAGLSLPASGLVFRKSVIKCPPEGVDDGVFQCLLFPALHQYHAFLRRCQLPDDGRPDAFFLQRLHDIGGAAGPPRGTTGGPPCSRS